MCCASLPLPSRATGGWRKCGFAVKSPPLLNVQAERWRRIDDLFQSALDRPPEDRHAFLDSACQDDAELRREVESLLALEGSSGLTTPAFEEAMAALDAHKSRAQEGRAIGPYRVLREIGQGGMGSVYLAA